MRIDVHAHYWTGDYLDLLAGLGQPCSAPDRHVPVLRFTETRDRVARAIQGG
jgi:hypothetical protein